MAKRKMREIWIDKEDLKGMKTGGGFRFVFRVNPMTPTQFIRFVESPPKKARKKR